MPPWDKHFISMLFISIIEIIIFLGKSLVKMVKMVKMVKIIIFGLIMIT